MKSQNQVAIREKLNQNASLAQASQLMLKEVRLINDTLYLITIIPLVLVFIVDSQYSYICSAVSLFLNILTAVLQTTMNNHKEKAILVLQLYEANITNTIYARIEYDRESTNEAYEYRHKAKAERNVKYHKMYVVPDNVEEKYTYLFTQRSVVAENRYLLQKYRILLATAMFLLAGGAIALITILNILHYQQTSDISQIIPQVVCFYPVVVPLITTFTEAAASIKRAVKISADIDNFFADHDKSNIRLERFNYYIQSLMFEFRLKMRPIPILYKRCFTRKLRSMQLRVCERFIQAIYDLEGLNTFGKMKNSAFIDAEIKTTDALGKEYNPNIARTAEEKDSSVPEFVNIQLIKTREAAIKARQLERIERQKALEKASSKSQSTATATMTRSASKTSTKTTKPPLKPSASTLKASPTKTVAKPAKVATSTQKAAPTKTATATTPTKPTSTTKATPTKATPTKASPTKTTPTKAKATKEKVVNKAPTKTATKPSKK